MKIKFYLYSLLFLSIFSYSQQTTNKNVLDCNECKEIVELYYQAYKDGITLNSINFYPMKALVVRCKKQNFENCGNKMKEQLNFFMGSQGGPISYGESSIWRISGNEDFSRFEFDKSEVINNFKRNISDNAIKDCNECKDIVSNFYNSFKNKTIINDNDFKILKAKVENCSAQKYDKCGNEMEKQLSTLQGGSGGPLSYGEDSKYRIMPFLGKVINLNTEFNDIQTLENGDVIFKYNQSYGVKDKNGFVFILPKYNYVENILFNNSHHFIISSQQNKYALFDISGKQIMPFLYDRLIANINNNNFLGYVMNGKFGVLDSKLKVKEPVYDYMFFRNKFCFIVKDEKYGFLNEMGNVAIEPKYKYNYRSSLNFEYYKPSILSNSIGGPTFYIPSDKLTVLENENRYGLINRLNYAEIALPKYDNIGHEVTAGNSVRGDRFILGKIPVKLNGKCGYIDEDGKIFIDCKYDEILGFGVTGYGNDKVSFVKNTGKYGLISNSTGLEVTPLKYDDINNGFTSNGITICTINKKKGILNSSGYEVISPRFDEIINFGASETSIVIENGLKGLINNQGSIIVNPKYQDIGEFVNGYASIKYNNKWGILSSNGTETVSPKYDSSFNFIDGTANVSLAGKSLKIDTNGLLIKEVAITSNQNYTISSATNENQGCETIILEYEKFAKEFIKYSNSAKAGTVKFNINEYVKWEKEIRKQNSNVEKCVTDSNRLRVLKTMEKVVVAVQSIYGNSGSTSSSSSSASESNKKVTNNSNQSKSHTYKVIISWNNPVATNSHQTPTAQNGTVEYFSERSGSFQVKPICPICSKKQYNTISGFAAGKDSKIVTINCN